MREFDYREALAWLETHVDLERVAPNRSTTPTLEPIRETLGLLADPHHDYPSIHITGTNGKGSTTTLTSALLATDGLRVGTFTSPDLHAVNERIAVNLAPISDEDFTILMARLADVESVSGVVLSRFELLTVAALLHFSDEGVDVAVVEVGMGGTWDSTNVIDGAVSVLTNVDLDHTAVLGPTVADIAADKVGIFRPGGVAVVASDDPVVVRIASERAASLGSELRLIDRDFALERNVLAVGGRAVSIRTPLGHYEDLLLGLHGPHQALNAATAVVAAESFLEVALGEDVVEAVFAAARMPGRLEVVGRDPLIVIDGAHNPAGTRALATTLADAFEVPGDRRCVVGVLSGRDLADTLEPLLAANFLEFHCCAPDSPRAVPASEIAATITRLGGVAYEHPSVRAALAHARERSSDDDLIVVTGSLYLVAAAREALLGVESRHAH